MPPNGIVETVMIVCCCKAVNDRTIRQAVAEGNDSFDALQFELGVGTCCGKCVAAVCEVLCEARAEMDATEASRSRSRTIRLVETASSRESALA
jgi:bacterioferritin-associated ferredoxin